MTYTSTSACGGNTTSTTNKLTQTSSTVGSFAVTGHGCGHCTGGSDTPSTVTGAATMTR